MVMRLTPELSRSLRTALVELAPDTDTIRRLVRGAGIPLGGIGFGGGASNVWFSVLEQAENHVRVMSLVAVVRSEFPSDNELKAAAAKIAAFLGVEDAAAIVAPTVAPSLPVTAQTVSALPAAPVASAAPRVDETVRVTLAPRHDDPWILNGPQQRELIAALRSTFTTYNQLQMMLLGIDKTLSSFAPNVLPLPEVALAVVTEAVSKGWCAPLLAQALHDAPDSPTLRTVALRLQYGRGDAKQGATARSGLEQMVHVAVPMLNLAEFLDHVAVAMRRVCCVRIDGKAKGTGFLVGRSAVLTNHHVVQRVLEAAISPEKVSVQFDFLESGGEGGGSQYALVQGDAWCIDYVPCAEFEKTAIGTGTPAPDELDYAVLHVAGAPGEESVPVLGRKEPSPRGWFSLWEVPPDLVEGHPLAVLQHPMTRPLELAFDTKGFEGTFAEGRRMRYAVNTDCGSSGSPVLTLDMKLVGLHHGGGENAVQKFNEGIPIERIAALLTAREKRALIDA